jgi:ATP-dependent Clp protease protease subunit
MTMTNIEMYLEYHINMEGRQLFLGEELDDPIAGAIIKGFEVLDKSVGPITLKISSLGGSVSSMYAIYDTMRACNNQIITLGTGNICSAACLLLAGGDLRYATENCWFMAHEGASNQDESSNITQLSRASVYAKMDKQWAGLMAKHSNKTTKWWITNAVESKKELWLNTEEMIKYGIVDSVWPPGVKV